MEMVISYIVQHKNSSFTMTKNSRKDSSIIFMARKLCQTKLIDDDIYLREDGVVGPVL